MERGGLRPGQVRGVRGYADRQLRVGGEPLDPRNRRVSVIVEHLYRTSSLPAGVRELASGAKASPKQTDAPVAPPPASAAHPPAAQGARSH
jgi:chemotaxis protein MotB